MTRIEDLIRESLERRAHDVEPTPALWRRISSRIDRRMRARRLLLAVAGGAAVVLIVAVAVPALTGRFQPDRTPDILDTPPGIEEPQLPGGVATSYAATDGSSVTIRETAAGSEHPAAGGFQTGESARVAARPGSRPDDWTVAKIGRGEGVLEISIGYQVAGSGSDDPNTGSVVPVASIPSESDLTEGAIPALAWSPDGRFLAWTVPTTEGETSLHIVEIPTRISPVEQEPTEIALDAAAPDVELQDWVGDTAASGDRSTITFTTSDGRLHTTQLELDPAGRPQEVATGPLLDGNPFVVASRAHHLGASGQEPMSYLLTQVEGGLRLSWLGQGTAGGSELTLPEPVAGADPDDVWMTARGNGVLVGLRSQGRVWLVTHDGQGGEAGLRALEGRTVHASFLGLSGAAVEPTPTPSVDTGPTEPPAESPVPDASSSVIVADGRRLVLVDRASGQTQQLLDMPAEGESTILNAAVRPGSTPDDLTVVFLALAEGRYDLRYVEVTAGEVDVTSGVPWQYLPDDLQPAAAGNPGEISIPAPVWSPDGDALAYAETAGEGDTQQLRVIGWGEDGPSDDPSVRSASFGLDLPEPIQLQDWVWTRDPDTGELLATEIELSAAAEVRIPIQRQADGAFATGPEGPLVLGTQVPVLDVADAHAREVEPETPSARLRWFRDGSVTLDLDPTSEGRPSVTMPEAFADQLEATGERPWMSPWMTAHGNTVYLGVGDGGYVVEGQNLRPLDLPDGLTPRYVAPLP